MSRWTVTPAKGYSLMPHFINKMQESIGAKGTEVKLEFDIDDSQLFAFIQKWFGEQTVIVKIIEKNIVLPAPKPVTTPPPSGASCPSCGGFVQINR